MDSAATVEEISSRNGTACTGSTSVEQIGENSSAIGVAFSGSVCCDETVETVISPGTARFGSTRMEPTGEISNSFGLALVGSVC